MRVAFGPRAGQKVRRLGRGFGWEDEAAVEKGKRCFSANGFTIHANRYVGMKERGALEKLLAYGARGAFCHRRLSRLDPAAQGGDLVYTLKTPWSDGTEAIVMSPAELMEKLVALIPQPYVHLSRDFGVFSSHSKWRRKFVLRPDVKKGFVAVAGSKVPARMSWSRLLARVFKIDISRCPSCGAKRRERWELVTDELFAARILCALGLYGRAPARAPPRCRNLFENRHYRLKPLMRAAEVREIRMHDLRHMFASHLYAQTKDLLLVKDVLGHRSIATTQVYLHKLSTPPTGSTDCLVNGASFLKLPARVVSIASVPS